MSALDAQVGFGEEATYGTPVVVTRFAEFSSESITATYATIDSTGLRPGRRHRSDSRFTRYCEGAAGDVQLEVVSKGLGFLLKHMLGAVATSGPVDSAYTHLATVGELRGKALTCQVGRPYYDGSEVKPFTYSGGKVTEWELANSNDSNLMLTLSLDFADEATGTALAVAAFPTGLETFSWVGGSVSIGGASIDVTDATVGGSNSLKTDRRYLRKNSRKKEPITEDYLEGTFELTADFDSLTQRDRVAAATAAGTVAQIVLNWEGQALIGATTKPSLTVTINARLDEFAANVDGPAPLEQSLSGVYLGSNAISMAYVTTDATP